MRAQKHSRLLFFNLLIVGFLLIYSLLALQTEPAAGLADTFHRQADSTAALFLPLVRQGASGVPAVSEPRLPDTYSSDQNDPPALPDAPQTGDCQSLIRFSNYTNDPVYVYWNRPDESDAFYKLLSSGRQYWQHTYFGNRWNIRDEQGRLIKSITATRCDNSFIDIYIGDLPACGRITTIALWDLTTEQPVPGYEALINGAVIPLAVLDNANLRVSVQEVIESIKFDLNGTMLISNVGPYSYPSPQQPWEPDAGVYTLVVEAYRQNDATSALCDQRRLTVQVRLPHSGRNHDANSDCDTNCGADNHGQHNTYAHSDRANHPDGDQHTDFDADPHPLALFRASHRVASLQSGDWTGGGGLQPALRWRCDRSGYVTRPFQSRYWGQRFRGELDHSGERRPGCGKFYTLSLPWR